MSCELRLKFPELVQNAILNRTELKHENFIIRNNRSWNAIDETALSYKSLSNILVRGDNGTTIKCNINGITNSADLIEFLGLYPDFFKQLTIGRTISEEEYFQISKLELDELTLKSHVCANLYEYSQSCGPLSTKTLMIMNYEHANLDFVRTNIVKISARNITSYRNYYCRLLILMSRGHVVGDDLRERFPNARIVSANDVNAEFMSRFTPEEWANGLSKEFIDMPIITRPSMKSAMGFSPSP